MNIARTVVVGMLFGLAGTGNPAVAVSVPERLVETERGFTQGGQPIHPRLVSHFLTWLSDKGYPFTVSVDVAAAADTGAYDSVALRKDEQGAIVCKNAQDRSTDGYRWFGRMRDGTHVVYAWHCGEDERMFPSALLFLRFSAGEGFLPDGKPYARLLMSAVRWFAPFDARSSVVVSGETVTISGGEGAAPVVLKSVEPKTPAPEPIDIKAALDEIDRKFFCGGKPVHPGLILNLVDSAAGNGRPVAVAMDVAAAFDSNQYFSDDVQEPEKGLYLVRPEEGQTSFAYHWVGRMPNGAHVVRTSLTEGSKAANGLCFVQFTRAQACGPEGNSYGQLLMTVLRTYPLPAGTNLASIRIDGNNVVFAGAAGETVVPLQQGNQAVSARTPAASARARVKADALRVRAAPSQDAEVLTKLLMGAEVVVIETPDNAGPWVRIKVPADNTTGWVHSDYLEYGGDGAAKTQFARVSVWKGDPRTEWPLDPKESGQATFIGVHGAFPSGTLFTVLAQDGSGAFLATAKQTITTVLAEGNSFAVTELVFENDSYKGKALFLGIAGPHPQYAAVEMKALTESTEIAKAAERVSAALPDFKRLPYDYEGSGFAASDTRTAVFSLGIDKDNAILATFTTPPKDQGGSPGTSCETAVLLWRGGAFVCSPDGGTAPFFFTLDGNVYCWLNFESCNSGARQVDLFECTGAAFRSVYANDDLGT